MIASRLLRLSGNSQRLASTRYRLGATLTCRPGLRSAQASKAVYSTSAVLGPSDEHVEAGTSEAGEGESGHIEAGHNEGILFFDSK